jgi:hypothetical protein
MNFKKYFDSRVTLRIFEKIAEQAGAVSAVPSKTKNKRADKGDPISNWAESPVVWHKDPSETAAGYLDDPTHSLMSAADGKVYSVRDILNQYESRPVREINPHLEKTLRKMLDHSFWNAEDGSRVSPNQILADPDNKNYAGHKQRIDNADLTYPIMLGEARNGGQTNVIDGVHRITKYFNEKQNNRNTVPLRFRRIAGTEKQLESSLLASPLTPGQRVVDKVVAKLLELKKEKKKSELAVSTV